MGVEVEVRSGTNFREYANPALGRKRGLNNPIKVPAGWAILGLNQ